MGGGALSETIITPTDFLKKRVPETIRKQQVNENHQEKGNQQPQHRKGLPLEDMVNEGAGHLGH